MSWGWPKIIKIPVEKKSVSRATARYLDIKRLKEEGKTYKEIADIMGFKSMSSVVNILKEHGRMK